MKTAIDKIHEFDRFGSVLGLERMTVLMELLGNPQQELSVIHVAGTNGKGSICKYIYEVLEENGYRVGLYTSPFLQVFNERIEVHRQYISDEELAVYTDMVLEKVSEMVACGHDSPTEFEVVTAVAFLYFARKQVDYVVLEVGLGGKGDSTNIVEHPLITVIASISYDHMDRLGNSLAEIAGEKAGIIKEGAPVVANVDYTESQAQREAAKVIARTAYEKHAVLYDVTKIKYGNLTNNIGGCVFDANVYGADYSGVEISMAGEHQIKNAITALTALEVLRKSGQIKVERSLLYAGMRRAKQIGRFEILRQGNPYIIIDGAHNEAGAKALADTMETHFDRSDQILVVAGMLVDKDVEKIVEQICRIGGDFIATEPENPRKLPAQSLCDILKEKGKNCVPIPDVEKACQEALDKGSQYQGILFAGSLYLIGKIKSVLETKGGYDLSVQGWNGGKE